MESNESIYETDSQTQTVVAKCGGVQRREGWTGSFGLVDMNYYVQDGYATRSYCMAQGTIFNIL